MTWTSADKDSDSAFGDDTSSYADYMFASVVSLAGSKRDANSQLAASEEPERPSKRKATAISNAAESHANLNQMTNPQFPDTCFETFCKGCDWEPPSCMSPCALPCSGDECTPDDACWDPHCETSCNQTPCEQNSPACVDDCLDPECTKLSDTTDPCCCQECDTAPCHLEAECHVAHTAPATDGTIYCFDNAPCHFQESLHGLSPVLSGYETYPCYSQAHGLTNHENDHDTQASTVATPALSAGNYTSLESAYSDEFSQLPNPYQSISPACFLDITAEHCHIPPATCCHGDARGCGDYPTAPREDLDIWYESIAQGNGLANSLVNFGFNSNRPTTTSSAPQPTNITSFNSSLQDPAFRGDEYSWMIPDPNYSNVYPAFAPKAPNLDLLITASQESHLRPDYELLSTSALDSRGLDVTSTSDVIVDENHAVDTMSACVCKWQHAPGFLCLAVFDDAEALHKHIKTSHVDTCTHCVCQWKGCEAGSKDFKQRSKLSRHLLGHAGHRPYPCSFEGCSKTFATNQAKDNHERTHTGDRPYVCDRCGYTTTTYTQLQTHISALHEGKKPHKCRFCDFSCADSSNLSKHERTHQVRFFVT
jgi:hypothetical protein